MQHAELEREWTSGRECSEAEMHATSTTSTAASVLTSSAEDVYELSGERESRLNSESEDDDTRSPCASSPPLVPPPSAFGAPSDSRQQPSRPSAVRSWLSRQRHVAAVKSAGGGGGRNDRTRAIPTGSIGVDGGLMTPQDLRLQVAPRERELTERRAMSPFKMKPFEVRLKESTEIREKCPDRIPVICEKAPSSPHLPDLDKRKFLVPASLSVSQLYCILRRRLKLDQATSLYLQCGNVVLASSSCLARIDADFRSIDGFLYINYCGQETFG